MHPFDLNGAYPNFMMDDEGEARLKATFGDNYPRLAGIKKKRPSQPFSRKPEYPPLHLRGQVTRLRITRTRLHVSFGSKGDIDWLPD